MNILAVLGLEASDVVRQAEAGECGLACIAMIARYHGDKADLGWFRRAYPLSSRGASLKDLIRISDQLGFHTRALKCGLDSLAKLSLPAILHWDLNHFVVLNRVRGRAGGQCYEISDPARGARSLRLDELANHFTGVALELTPSVGFTPASKRPRLKIEQLWTRISGLGPAVGRILALSIIMQAITLVTPFYMQLAIDTALPAADIDLLLILAVGFSSLLLINALSMWIRGRLTLSLANSLTLQTAVNLFRHTLFLPSSWFEKRHLGDVVSRFGSLQPISDLLSRGLVSSLVDGALAVTTLILMILYSGVLTALVVAVVGVYAIVKILFFHTVKIANANLLTAQAIENSAFIENVRGISAIKIFCQEGNRQRLWQNKKADVVNGTIKLGRITSTFDTANSFVVALENIIFVYVGLKMVMDGTITLGMIFAFQAYKQNFLGAATRLIDQVQSYKLLDVHLARISDIALESREADIRGECSQLPYGVVELKDVSFTYGTGLPFVLRGVNLRLEPGKTTVIVGVSGSGKTTLLKILCGLLQPTTGRILIDSIPVHEFGLRHYRERLGVVCQEDTLFAGSIAENIAFFDPDYDLGQVADCCRQAAIHDDILAMPMRYETMVGDMGSNLSGGQKQRILLARALYKQPHILLLDEGTAHLDVMTETKVVGALKQLEMTRIMVAHRPDTIRSADIVYQVVDGHVIRLIPTNTEGADNAVPATFREAERPIAAGTDQLSVRE